MKTLFSKFTKTVIVIDVFLSSLLLLLYIFDIDKFKDLIFSVSFVIFALLYFGLNVVYVKHRLFFESLVEKYCGPKASDILRRESLSSVETEEIEAEWKTESLSREHHKKVPDFPEYEDRLLVGFVEALNNGEYKKILQDIPSLLKKEEETKKIALYRILLEFAFSQANIEEFSMEDRINNLDMLLQLNIKDVNLKIKFYLSYIGCNLFQNNFLEAERATYNAISIAKKEKANSSLLAKLYKIQIPIFMCQRKISEALASGKEAIKYGDKNLKSRVYFDLANIYFYYLHNPHMAAYYSSLSWGLICKGAKYISKLVNLYYVAHFFDDQIELACDFLKNYVENEHNKQPIDNLSYLLYKNGERNKALEYSQICINTLPQKDTIASRNILARLDKDKGNYSAALELFSEILPSFAKAKDDYFFKYFWLEILYNRAICYLKLGNFELAKQDMNIVLNSNFDEIDSTVLEEFFSNGISFLSNKDEKEMTDER